MLGWFAGIAIGYLPQLLMLAFVPGYASAFFALLERNVNIGSNVATPVPWPWSIPADYGGIFAIHWVVEGFFYVAIVGFVIYCLGRVLRLSRAQLSAQAVLVSAACVVASYAHHTFSRADYVHLAHSVPGVCLGILASCFGARAALRRWLPASVTFALLVLSAFGTSLHMPLVAEAMLPVGSFAEIKVAGRLMHVSKYYESVIRTGQRLANHIAKPDEPVLFVPHIPGLYPVTNRFSPVQHLLLYPPDTWP